MCIYIGYQFAELGENQIKVLMPHLNLNLLHSLVSLTDIFLLSNVQ